MSGSRKERNRVRPGNGRPSMPVEESRVRSLFGMVRADPARSRRGGAPVAFVVFRKTVG